MLQHKVINGLNDGDGTNPARPKPAPELRHFDLGALMLQSGDWWGENSRRCVEVLQQERDYVAMPGNGLMANGIRVPDRLLAGTILRRSRPLHGGRAQITGRIEAAVTTTATADFAYSGLGPFIYSLVTEGEILPYLDVVDNLMGTVQLPRVTTPPSTGPSAETMGLAAPAPVALTVDALRQTPRILRGLVHATPELDLTVRGMLGDFVGEELTRHMAANAEDQIWAGTGANGQVEGLEAVIATGNTIDRETGLTSAKTWEAVEGLNVAKIRRRGRFWAASRQASAEITASSVAVVGANTGIGRVDREYAGERTLHGWPLIDSTRPAEEANTGRLWHISGMDIRVGFYSSEIEIALHVDPATHERRIGYAKPWNVVIKRDDAFRVIRG